MLFGLGAGLGFLYWHMKGLPPMILGRGNVHRPGVEGLEITTGVRTGVVVERFATSSRKKATAALHSAMTESEPMMIHVDMGYLPYFDLPEDYHFGGHVVVVCGYDPESDTALLADRDLALHPVAMNVLADARGSTYKPFPPRNTWYRFDFQNERPVEAEDCRAAILEVCETMLDGPISNLGVRGINKAAERIRDWPKTMNPDELCETCAHNYIFIDAQGGTGGGIFRYMYSRFLEEAASIVDESSLTEFSTQLRHIGDRWQEVAELFLGGSTQPDPIPFIMQTAPILEEIATEEEGVWKGLREVFST